MVAQGGEDRLAAVHGERGGPGLLLGVRLDRVVDLLDLAVVGLGQPDQLQPVHRLTGQGPAAGQIAAGDQLLLRVAGQPALTGPHQLVDLVRGDPVVLGVVEHREQDVQVAQGVREGEGLGLQHQPDVARVAPLGELGVQRHGLDGGRPAERLEQAPYQVGAAAGGQRRDLDAQRQRPGGTLGTDLAHAAHRAGEDVAQRDGEEGRGRVRTVVDVLREGRVGSAAAALALAAPDQRHRVDLQQQRRRAALLRRLRVEHVGRAEGGGERLRLVRMLVQQETEVGRGVLGGTGGGDGQEHGPLRPGRRCNGRLRGCRAHESPRGVIPGGSGRTTVTPSHRAGDRRLRLSGSATGGRYQASCDWTWEEISSRWSRSSRSRIWR